MKDSMKRGFTLLEVLVAVMVLGTAVAAISGVLGTSMRNVGRAEDYQRVTLLSRSQMNELMTLPWKDGQTWNGQWAEGYRWRAQASRVLPGSPAAQQAPYELMRMTLVGTWKTTRGEKTYTLETARVQQKPRP
jgi:prepilin-type N-terminal cleavage/methylation domain-containing protein